MLEVPLFSTEECRVIETAAVEALSLPGYEPSFFLFDLSTEVPLQDLSPEVRSANLPRETTHGKGG